MMNYIVISSTGSKSVFKYKASHSHSRPIHTPDHFTLQTRSPTMSTPYSSTCLPAQLSLAIAQSRHSSVFATAQSRHISVFATAQSSPSQLCLATALCLCLATALSRHTQLCLATAHELSLATAQSHHRSVFATAQSSPQLSLATAQSRHSSLSLTTALSCHSSVSPQLSLAAAQSRHSSASPQLSLVTAHELSLATAQSRHSSVRLPRPAFWARRNSLPKILGSSRLPLRWFHLERTP